MPATPQSSFSARRVLSALKKFVKRAVPGLNPTRAQYKKVWNAQARTEDGAKIGVQGCTDEACLRHTAAVTRQLLEECVGIFPGDTILEIGAGVGRVGQVLAPLCKEWIGADVSENMLGHLRRRLAGVPNVRTVAVNGYDLGPIPSATVDLVYCTVVFMHLDEWERFNYVREGFRVLRPGGRMLVDNFSLLNEPGWALFQQLLQIPPLDRPPHFSKSSTPQELECYFRRAGFRDIGQKEQDLWIITYGTKPA